MGQVLGFSHCRKFIFLCPSKWMIARLDFYPGGNEESEMCDLQTAREWSDDDEVEEHSFELTFSYIAIAEAEAVGSSRHYRERRRAVPRVGRTPLIRTDTLEMLLDSTDVDWETQAFFNQDEDEETSGNGALDLAEPRTANPGRRREREQGDSIRVQPSPETVDSESQRTDTGDGQEDSESQTGQTSSEIHSSQQHNPSQTTLGKRYSRQIQYTYFSSLNA
uniref:Uncharacterized protein n=1 Tax=Cyprinodon variegatus TaxID=28743 RepID=A0A3Q2EG01_CYPVA